VGRHDNEIDVARVRIVDDRAVGLALADFSNDSYSALLCLISGISNDPLAVSFEDVNDITLHPDDGIFRRIRDVEDVNRRIVGGRDIQEVVERVRCTLAPVGRKEDLREHNSLSELGLLSNVERSLVGRAGVAPPDEFEFDALFGFGVSL